MGRFKEGDSFLHVIDIIGFGRQQAWQDTVLVFEAVEFFDDLVLQNFAFVVIVTWRPSASARVKAASCRC